MNFKRLNSTFSDPRVATRRRPLAARAALLGCAAAVALTAQAQAAQVHAPSFASVYCDGHTTVLCVGQSLAGTTLSSTVVARVGFIPGVIDGVPTSGEPSPVTIPIVGDLTGDGHVDGLDLSLLLGEWGSCSVIPTSCDADLDHNGVVNGLDLAIILSNWG